MADYEKKVGDLTLIFHDPNTKEKTEKHLIKLLSDNMLELFSKKSAAHKNNNDEVAL